MNQSPSVYDLLMDRLVNGGFDWGQRLKAEDLRNEYQCSASTIREALFRLSTIGLVDFQEQRGFRAPLTSSAQLHEVTHMRILLECEGTCLSIRLGGVAWEARLSAAHHKLSHIESRSTHSNGTQELTELLTQAEREFHETLIDACGCSLLKSQHLTIYRQFRQHMIGSNRQTLNLPENIIEHQGILDAALDRDEVLVRKLIHDHLARNLAHPLPEPNVPQATVSSSSI